jgi:hypothetical protein
LGIVLFLLAWLVFDPCTRGEKESAPVRRWFFQRTVRRSRMPAAVVGMRAVSWKDFSFNSGGWFGLALKFGVIGFLMVLCNVFALELGNNRSGERLEFEGGLLIWLSIAVTAIGLALDAARVFRDEVRWKTLSSLATLPVSISELAYRKVAGTLLGTLPLLAGVVLGMMLMPKGTADFLGEIFSHPDSFLTFAAVIFQYILFLHLTAFLSLVVKRGALPLAIAIQYVGGLFLLGFFAMAFSGGGGPEVYAVMMIIFCVVMTFILHHAIGSRLARAAAEE